MAAKMIKLPSKAGSVNVISQDDETVLITGHEAETDKLIKYKFDESAARKGLETVRKLLAPLVANGHRATEKAGRFASKVLLQGTHQRAQFSFTNAFGSIDASQRKDLAEAVGPKFDELFEEQESMGVRPDRIEALRAAIVAVGMDPEEYFQSNKVLKPVSNFRRKRFEARSEMTEAQNDVLDAIVDQIAATPALTTK